MKTDNWLIAEFMGMKYSKEVDEDRSDCGGIYEKVTYYSYHPIPVDDYGDQVYVNREGLIEGQILKEGPLKYDSSWDWLIPVVEKIEKEKGIQIAIYPVACEIYYFGKCLTNITEDSKISAIYKAVVEFIKWFNTKNL